MLSDDQVETKIREHFKHYDFFAMVKQTSSLIIGTTQWVIEWSDADATRACADYLYKLGWVNVSLTRDFSRTRDTTNAATG